MDTYELNAKLEKTNHCLIRIDNNFLNQTINESLKFKTVHNNDDILIITDVNVYDLYPELFKNKKVFVIVDGESSKSFDTVTYIINELKIYSCNRKTVLVGIGGGVITDIIGFVANIFMRGIDFVFVPTSLLAMVDAAIGGKNAINFENIKNYIGTFNLPSEIVCDVNFLKTLPYIEFKSGFGEILKYAVIADNNLFDCLYSCNNFIESIETKKLMEIVNLCIQTKNKIVEQDYLDTGIRQILNFGHSFGHCFEMIDGLPHGIAVVKGISVALDVSEKLNFASSENVNKVKDLLLKFDYDIDYCLSEEHFELLVKDKKIYENKINFVFFRNIADVFCEAIEIERLQKILL